MDNTNYDELMQQAQQQLEFQKKHEEKMNNNQESDSEIKDLYAEFREDSDTNNNTKPELNNNYNSNKPDIDLNNNIQKEEYYIDPDDTPVFENGPGISRVQLWKKEYGVDNIYHTKILDRDFLFRTLKRSEYEQIASMSLDSLTDEELICKTCVLFPFNYDYSNMGKDDAGYPSTLSQIIMENSGFTNEYGIEVL